MEGIRGIQHPLETPVVLDCIFKNLDLNDLKKCRQVCRTWRHESGKAMRALAEVEIHFHQGSQRQRGPSKFLGTVQTNESTFFEAPFADTFALVRGVADNPGFWETLGSYIKTLTLHRVTFSSTDTFRHAIFEWCPNLQKLELHYVEVCGEPAPKPKEWVPRQLTPNRNFKSLSAFGIKKDLSIGWLEILSQFPCLEKLDIHDVSDFEDVFGALEIVRQHDASCWKLNEVTLMDGEHPFIALPSSFVRVFGEGDLALTSFSIQGIVGNAQNVTSVQKILVTHAHSLRKLVICLDPNPNYYPETDIFPLPGNQVLENVQVLKLFNLMIRSTRFLQAFPNVKELILHVDEIPEDTETPHVTLENCTQLILSDRIEETDDFKRLFGLLPNLKKLWVYSLDNEKFSLICENWTDLTHLDLGDEEDAIFMEVDDAGISGYDRKDVRKINKKGRRGSWRPVTVRRANLSSLKNLCSFSMKLCSDQFSKVGYCSKACGILELPNLKHLRVKRAAGDGIGEEVVPMFESLSEQFPWDDRQKISFD